MGVFYIILIFWRRREDDASLLNEPLGGSNPISKEKNPLHPLDARALSPGGECRSPTLSLLFLDFAKVLDLAGGGERIRTSGTIAGTVLFESTPFDHSGTPPYENSIKTKRQFTIKNSRIWGIAG